MSFWKFFKRGAIEPAAQDSPPAASSAKASLPARKAVQPKVPVESVAPPPPTPDLEIKPEKPVRPVAKGGFDPYNSGAFDRRGNWDKTRLK